jgi:casein kinase 1
MSIINNKYKLLQKINEGEYGVIYKGTNIRTKEDVAIKLERIEYDLKMLKHESSLYNYLRGIKCVPTLKWYGKQGAYYYMVTNLLGSSLSDDVKNNEPIYSLEFIANIAIKLIRIVQTIHEKKLIHRDIKPANFLYDKPDNRENLFIIDFGLCRSYVNHTDDEHIPMKKTHGLIGSPNYASINAHLHNELGRRDDIESLGYTLLFLYKKRINWAKCTHDTDIIRAKQNIVYDPTLTEPLRAYFIYTFALNFEAEPDYDFLCELFL